MQKFPDEINYILSSRTLKIPVIETKKRGKIKIKINQKKYDNKNPIPPHSIDMSGVELCGMESFGLF
jgi:hypothetical protein